VQKNKTKKNFVKKFVDLGIVKTCDELDLGHPFSSLMVELSYQIQDLTDWS
jgi:hypothetical protein